MAAFLFSNPQAPERNSPIVPQFYSPSIFFITGIILGQATTVTTAVAHNYVIGNTVRLHIPQTYGTRQLNEQSGLVISIPSPTQVLLAIDSTQYDSFNSSPAYGPTKPQICGTGDYNSGAINAYGRVSNITYIPGSFLNTSPIEGPWLD
jgi:hypothetical protein